MRAIRLEVEIPHSDSASFSRWLKPPGATCAAVDHLPSSLACCLRYFSAFQSQEGFVILATKPWRLFDGRSYIANEVTVLAGNGRVKL